MNLLRSLAMAFSMFSRLPVPRVEWKKENMGYMLALFPLVGAALGLALLIWDGAMRLIAPAPALYALGMTLIPVIMTGGIHLDGLADTADALASHAPPERKREILKDSHAGAFALIAVASVLLARFALIMELANCGGAARTALLIPVLGRSLSASFSLLGKGAGGDGFLSAFRSAAERGAAAVALGFLILSAAGMAAAAPLPGAVTAAAGIAAAALCYLTAKRQFGGMSGDLAGFMLEVSESAMLAALTITLKAVAI